MRDDGHRFAKSAKGGNDCNPCRSSLQRSRGGGGELERKAREVLSGDRAVLGGLLNHEGGGMGHLFPVRHLMKRFPKAWQEISQRHGCEC